MIGHGITSLEFEEPDRSARIPESLELIAAACWVGFRLLRKPQAGIENLLVGKQRLGQFRQAKKAEVRRVIRYHFYSRKVEFLGDSMTLGQFRDRWESDVTLRDVVRDHPAFEKWRVGLAGIFAGLPLVAMASEENRFCYGRFGGDPFTLSEMNRMMEEGGIEA